MAKSNKFNSFLSNAHENYWRELTLSHKAALDTMLNKKGLNNLGQPLMLIMLARNEDLTVSSQKDLAEWLHVTPATITVSLRSLERKGYVTKTSDTADLRRKRITMTDKGYEAAGKVLDVYNALEKAMYAGFSDEEKEQALNLFKRMSDNLQNIE